MCLGCPPGGDKIYTSAWDLGLDFSVGEKEGWATKLAVKPSMYSSL